MAYRDYPTRVPVDPIEKAKFLRKVGLEHLLRIWKWFEVYHLNPYTPPYFALPKKDYEKKDNDEGGEGGRTGDGFIVVEIKKLFQIFDFGDYLATSAGEEIGSLSNAQLLRTVDKMLDMLEKRGAKEIAFGKRCLDSAKLYAWQQAIARGMVVYDFQPGDEALHRLEHTYGPLLERALTATEIIVPE